MTPIAVAKKPSPPAASRLEEEPAASKAPAKFIEEEEPKEKPVARVSRLAEEPEKPAAAPKPASTAPPAPALPPVAVRKEPERRGLAASARIGLTSHLQLGVVGPSLGVALDYGPLPALWVRLSVDYQTVSVSFRAHLGPPGQGSTDYSTRVWAIPILAQVLYELPFNLGPARPYGGLAAGVVAAGAATTGSGGAGPQGAAMFVGLAPIAGADAKLGPGRAAVEARLLLTVGGEIAGTAKDLQAGGFIAQATYRYAF